MSQKPTRAEARRRARRGAPPQRQTPRLGRKGLIAAAVLALAVVGGLIWLGNAGAAPSPAASYTPPPGASSGEVGTYVRGEATAPVTVEEWADFQCPACGQFARLTDPQLMSNYVATGKVRFVFHDFPFLGNESFWAAEAAACAADQGKFWEYHDKLFASQAGENRGAFSKENLKRFGDQLGLGPSFGSCVDSGRYTQGIRDSAQRGQALGVDSTPTLFVNGKKYARALTYDQMKAILDPLINK